MVIRIILFLTIFVYLTITQRLSYAQNQRVNVVCSYQENWCKATQSAFAKFSGINVQLTLKSTSEALNQIIAEKNNPKNDVWIGGTGDPHLQAAELGLTMSYKSPALAKLRDWARKQAEQSNFQTVGIYAGALGLGYNPQLLEKKKTPPPKCWRDLLNPIYKDEIQVANPESSGTAYVVIATLIQLMGEQKAFNFLKLLHENVNQYTRSGLLAIKAVANEESSISISFIHDGITESVNGFPVKVITPCEGTGYEIGSMSIIKGAKNQDNAKKFYEWALSSDGQKIGQEVKQFQLPSNSEVSLPSAAPNFSQIKFIDYDFVKYGKAEERKRLLARWDREIGTLPIRKVKDINIR